jgi:pimeloyl-ACP methyl ester carboxylesterase
LNNRKSPDHIEGFVQTSGKTNLYYEIFGQGSSLILCDGLLCSGHIWKYFVPAFAQDHQLIHWHYPGHGLSDDPMPEATLSVAQLGDHAAEVADCVGCDGAVVVGHSLGVQVALETWKRHPDLVKALILICGSPGKITENFHGNAALSYVVPMLHTLSRLTPELVASLWQGLPQQAILMMALQLGEVNKRLIKQSDLLQYMSGLSRVDFRVAIRMLENAGKHDAVPYLRDVDVPVLIIAGENDTFTPPGLSRLMASRIPNVELLMAGGGTHSLPLEQPDLVNLRIRRFLDENTLG